ncbi:MAG: T9SS type A sorting domain-containing protein [Prolixibacteraceae bacterium]
MKNKIFTKNLILTAVFLIGAVFSLSAQDDGIGTGWDNLNPTSPLLLNENFSGFDFFGNWAHTNNSNSKDVLDEATGEITPANMAGEKTIEMIGSTYTVTYTWDSCAFAPEWGVAASVDNDGVAVDPNPTTSGVSNGFVEIARPGYGTLAGEFIIDLRNIEFVEAIQYSHSSCGGKRRGFVLCYSLDDAMTWDTLRYQLGDHYQLDFTEDTFTKVRTPNNIRCAPSASGMLWEDAIYTDNVMLRFTADSVYEPQAVRIHDFKVYGELPEEPVDTTGNAIPDFNNNYKIRVLKNVINISEPSNVNIYNMSGALIKNYSQVNTFSIIDLPVGVYIVKARAGKKVGAAKIVKN